MQQAQQCPQEVAGSALGCLSLCSAVLPEPPSILLTLGPLARSSSGVVQKEKNLSGHFLLPLQLPELLPGP